MIDHTGLLVKDPAKSRIFYDKALAPLGYTMMMEVPKEHTGGAAVFGYDVEIISTLSKKLNRSHFVEILAIKDDLKRDFYAEMCRVE